MRKQGCFFFILLTWSLHAAAATPSSVLAPSQILQFDRACEPGQHATLAAVGDVLLHSDLQIQAFASGEKRFRSLWERVEPFIRLGESAYANLEGPVATGVTVRKQVTGQSPLKFDNNILTSWPRFNYHPTLIEDLLKSGFTVVSTANNHALDRGSIGVDKTLENLTHYRLSFTGTRVSSPSNTANDSRFPWYTLNIVNGIRLAFVSCAEMTNGIPDENYQVFSCKNDRTAVLDVIRKLSTNKNLADAVILTPHWGTEYQTYPNAFQVKLAQDAAEAGALAIIGSHPHVLEPWNRIKTSNGREAFVIYSMGNFVSGQVTTEQRSSLILYLGFTKTAAGEVVLNGARYLPIYTNRSKVTGERGIFVEVADRTRAGQSTIQHVESLFSPRNRLFSTEPLVLNPECPPQLQLRAR